MKACLLHICLLAEIIACLLALLALLAMVLSDFRPVQPCLQPLVCHPTPTRPSTRVQCRPHPQQGTCTCCNSVLYCHQTSPHTLPTPTGMAPGLHHCTPPPPFYRFTFPFPFTAYAHTLAHQAPWLPAASLAHALPTCSWRYSKAKRRKVPPYDAANTFYCLFRSACSPSNLEDSRCTWHSKLLELPHRSKLLGFPSVPRSPS